MWNYFEKNLKSFRKRERSCIRVEEHFNIFGKRVGWGGFERYELDNAAHNPPSMLHVATLPLHWLDARRCRGIKDVGIAPTEGLLSGLRSVVGRVIFLDGGSRPFQAGHLCLGDADLGGDSIWSCPSDRSGGPGRCGWRWSKRAMAS